MHEMSLVTSLLAIIREEMLKHHKTKLRTVRVRYGALANVVPEALTMGFEVLTDGTDLEGAVIELLPVPVVLRCGACDHEFEPETMCTTLFAPCSRCGDEFGHTVVSGKELYIENIEVE